VECESKIDTRINRGDWNQFKITQTIPEQHTGKYGIKELQKKKKESFGHCTHNRESANVKVQNIFHGLNNVTCSTDCKCRTAVTLYTLETWFVSVI